MRFLEGFQEHALTDVGHQRAARGDVPEATAAIVGRFARPEREDVVDRLEEHGAAVGIEVAHDLHVGALAAGADAEDKATLEQVIDHRDVAGERGRMVVRQVYRATAQANGFRRVREAGDERQAGRNGFRGVGKVLADEGFGIAELVREHDRLAVFPERLRVVALRGVHRHGEVAEFHALPFVPAMPAETIQPSPRGIRAGKP